MLQAKASRVACRNLRGVGGTQIRTMYGIFHSEGRFDPIFKPQYDEHGQNLNDDNCWHMRPCPPCSITGKPRRQLGHYPKFGHPIVPFHRLDYKGIADNLRTPAPWWDEPESQVSLKDMNWFQIKLLLWLLLCQWLYTCKHFFRECDELHFQAAIREFPYVCPLWYTTPNYWYRLNHPEKRWNSCNPTQEYETQMAWDMNKAVNNTGIFFNVWLEPLEYDKNGRLMKGEYSFEESVFMKSSSLTSIAGVNKILE